MSSYEKRISTLIRESEAERKKKDEETKTRQQEELTRQAIEGLVAKEIKILGLK